MLLQPLRCLTKIINYIEKDDRRCVSAQNVQTIILCCLFYDKG